MVETDQKMEIERAERGESGAVKIDEEEESRKMAPWTKQITPRGLVTSLIIGIMYSVIVMKLNLTTGLVPNLNVSVALLAFIFVRSWTKLLKMAGFVSTPFTRQENTVIQTCAVACYSIAVGGGLLPFHFHLSFVLKTGTFCDDRLFCSFKFPGGFGSYLLGLNRRTYEQAGVDTVGNNPGSWKEPGIGWMTGFLFGSSFVGLLALVPLRKVSPLYFYIFIRLEIRV